MTEPTSTAPPPPGPPAVEVEVDGWYPDPAGSGHLRWWEEGAWTSWVNVGSISVHQPLPQVRTAPALARLPTHVVWWGLLGALAAILVSGVGTFLVDSVVASLVAGVLGLYGTLTLTVWLVSRRYGTASLIRDFGLRFRWADLGAGFAASVAGRALGLAGAILVLAAREGADDDPSAGQFDAFETSDFAVIVAVIVAVIAAPLFEELFFRGLLQSSLETRLGPWWAIAIASVLFGGAHLSFDNSTTANLALFVVTGMAGATLGFTFWATRRLGTAIVAHGFFNLFAAVVLLIDRYG